MSSPSAAVPHARLSAFYLAYYAALTHPHLKVDLVTFGAPNVGDEGFARGFNERVNNRHVTFTGVGKLGESYHLGDWIAQVGA